MAIQKAVSANLVGSCTDRGALPTDQTIMWDRIQSADYRPGSAGFYLIAIAAVAALYVLILALTSGGVNLELLGNALANVGVLVFVSMATRAVLLTAILELRGAVQIAAHIACALVFTASWFFLLMVFLGVVADGQFTDFSVRAFIGGAALWQMAQGLAFYAIVALLAYIERLQTSVEASAAPSEIASQPLLDHQMFVRDGDEMRPLDTTRVICVHAAGDYAEVTTKSGKHILRSSLNHLEENLGSSFLRIHRSTIVSIDYIDRVEPAGGGRLTVHLSNGVSVIASRSGAKLIREKTL
ncbi:MAG: LytTR family DNA-binding domain-containing protein [Pseudomonadota bacterium]